ncbi:hypothetical protein ACUOFC_31160, partial [Escherichia sp. TWPC-MK]
PQPNLNPITGFGVGDIPVGETVIVTFQATVTNITITVSPTGISPTPNPVIGFKFGCGAPSIKFRAC